MYKLDLGPGWNFHWHLNGKETALVFVTRRCQNLETLHENLSEPHWQQRAKCY